MRVLNYLSDLLTFFSPAKEVEDLGQCIHPECGCNLFFKTQEEIEICPINKWKK